MDFNVFICIHCLTYIVIFNDITSVQAQNTSELSNRSKRMDCRTANVKSFMRFNNVIDMPITKSVCNVTTVASLNSIVLVKFVTAGLVNPIVRVFHAGCREATQSNDTVAFVFQATDSTFTLNFRYEDACGRSDTFWCTINIKQGLRKEIPPKDYSNLVPLIIAILVSVFFIGVMTIGIAFCYLQRIILFREAGSTTNMSSASTTTKDRYNPIVL